MKMAGYGDIFEDGKVKKECRTLESAGQTHSGYPAGGQTVYTLALHIEYLSCGGSVHAADNIEEGGLPRTIRANYSSYFAFLDGEINIVQRCKTAEVPAQSLHFKY
jgi:hypothetical protein